MMTVKVGRRIALAALCLGAALLVAVWYTDRAKSQRISKNIELYLQNFGNLPDPSEQNTMKNLGFELREGWHPNYERMGAQRYRLTILKGFDGPYWFYD